MIKRTTAYTLNLDAPTVETRWDNPLTYGDKNADAIQATLMRGSAAATLTGLTAILYGVRSDGTTTFVAGNVSGNVVTATLDYTFYAIPGKIELLLQLAEGTAVYNTPLRITAYVKSGQTGELVSAGEQFSLANLQAIVAECQSATAEATSAKTLANSAATSANAAATSAATAAGTASTAAGAANSAAGSANSAATVASTAAGSANTAAGAANTAAGAANTAAGAANAAAGNASSAATAANEAAGNANTAAATANALPKTFLAPRYMRYTGKIYSVSFQAPATSMSSAGTRGDDAVGLVANPSTDAVKGVNDFDNLSPFNLIRCNGYVDASGEPIPTAFEGDPAFKLDGTNGDVWAFGLTPWFKLEFFGDGSEKHSVSDTYHGAGWFPNPGSIRTDKSVRPYVMTACYRGTLGDDGKVASISGCVPIHTVSHNSQLTQCRAKGAQYCGYTSKDNFYLHELFTVEYATMNCQSVMAGDADRYWQHTPAITETGVKRFIVTNAQAENYYVGMCVSIGYPSTFSSGTTFNIDRGITTMHARAGRVRITAITALGDGLNTALTVDASANFDTTNTTVNIAGVDYSAPCYLSTMPNYSGITDTVLGPSGSPRSNTNSKNDCRYRYVENPYGSMYIPYSDIIKNYPNLYTCYDCTKFSTTVTADYTTIGYVLSAHSGWYYVTTLGFDATNPSVRLATVCTATSSTRWADGQYEDMVAGEREVLGSGSLAYGGTGGFACATLLGGLTFGWWDFGLRLSSTGRCGRVAAAA